MYHYYFTVGFNLWMVWIVVSFAIMAWLCWTQYKLNVNRVKVWIATQYGNNVLPVMEVIFTIIFGLLFSFESWRGIIQFLDNHAGPEDSPLWSLVLMPIVVAAVIAIYWYVMRFVRTKVTTVRYDLIYARFQDANRAATRRARRRQQTEREDDEQYGEFDWELDPTLAKERWG